MENTTANSHIQLLQNLRPLVSPKSSEIESPSDKVDSFDYDSQREMLIESGFFDSSYYLKSNPDVLENKSDPIEHFLAIGYLEDRNPNPVFDMVFYKRSYQLEIGDLNPAIHYLVKGKYLDYAVNENHPYVAKNYSLLRLYFDESNYFNSVEKEKFANKKLAIPYTHPIEHYLEIGYLESRRVNILFDRSYYEEKYPESLKYSDSFLHFINEGEVHGYSFHPIFDIDFYKKACREKNAPLLNKRVFADFLSRHQDEFVSPCTLFDGGFYLMQNSDVAESGANPFLHYIRHGFAEVPVRDPHPLFSVDLYKNTAGLGHDIEVIEHFLLHETSNSDEVISSFKFDKRGWLRDKASNANGKTLLDFLNSSEKDAQAYIDSNYLVKKKLQELVSFYEESSINPQDILFEEVEKPLVTIIIPNFNQAEATLNCLHSLSLARTKCSFEVIVVDDASTDKDTILLKHVHGITLHTSEVNQGYIAACNRGASLARGDYIVQLNNDTLLLDGWLDALLDSFSVFPNVGLVGALLIFPDGLIQEAGGVVWQDAGGLNFGRGQEVYHSSTGYVREVDYCSGACIMLKKSVWDELDGYDTYYSPAYYEDTDLAFRIRELGLKVVYQPQSKVIHLEGLSSGTDESQGTKRYQRINKAKFYDRWKKVLANHTQKNYRDRYSIGNVLFIDAYVPTPDRDSGSLDIMNYIQFFQNCDYKVSFLPMMNMVSEGEYTKQLQARGVEWIGSPGYNTPYEYLLAEGQFYDLVIIYRAHVTYMLIDLVRECCPNAKVVYDTVDLHHLRHLREAELTNNPNELEVASIVKRQEMSNIMKADATILLSDYEYETLNDSVNSDLLYVIPIARACVGTQVGYKERQDILFLGGFSHTPNVDCLKYLVNDIMPILKKTVPHIKLRVVGADITEELLALASENVMMEGYVEDLKEVFDSVRMLIAPLRIGAGMKGKVVSAMTHGLPCVISDIAAEGMNLTNEQGVIIANEANAIAEAVQRLYEDEELWVNMSNSAYALAVENFSVVHTYEKLYTLLQDLSLPVPTNFIDVQENAKK